MKITKLYLKELTYNVMGAIIEVHKNLGPGLLENIYHQCLIKELKDQNINFRSELTVPVHYKGLNLDTKLRCDLLVEGVLVVELKSVKDFLPIFDAQLLTYMNLLNAPKGVLINFNVTNIFKEGQKTFVNNLFRDLPD